jgi:two-component system CheB/CheR fusion protein
MAIDDRAKADALDGNRPDPWAGGCLIVGVGASAGGLEAFQRFLRHMPPHAGIALVYVQHLDPRHESVLPELLARHALMPVQAVHDETPVEPGNAYVIPPNTSLTLQRGVLRLGPRLPPPDFGKPIDGFLISLAQDQGDRAVGIILSGTGSDGTAGLRAIKDHGGTTIAQTPGSAAYDSMPQSAIAAGLVDYVLPPEEMPERLVEQASQAERLAAGEPHGGTRWATDDANSVDAVCDTLRRQTGHDFASYKRNTLVRRISRRMDALQLESAAQYVQRLEQDPIEATRLFQEMLIGVTAFFRDPEAFDVLAQAVVPRLVEAKGADDQVRLWVAGCASGEEVYSLAILLREHLASRAAAPRAQIFATDIDEEGLRVARKGAYPESIGSDVSPERLERFFTREDGGYQVRKELRQMCVFSKHNLLHDPPFSELDLVSCRNLLIYMDNRIQGKAIGLFHHALRPGGFLFLGPAENVGGQAELFEAVERKQRIYRRLNVTVRAPMDFPLTASPSGGRSGATRGATPAVKQETALWRNLERAVLDEFVPAGMVVRAAGEVVFLFGPTAKYLGPSAGAPSVNAFSLVHKSLRIELRGAVGKAARTHEPVVMECAAQVRPEGPTERVKLIVRPFTEADPSEGLYLVIFQELAASDAPQPEAAPAAYEADVRQLQYELRNTREQLQETIDKLESANQELQSGNQELLSLNEEMQSANEELQSSKEEVQTINAELESVNRELTQKVEELDAARSDLEALFEGAQVATIFLDNDLLIKRFTPTATEVFRLRTGDVGRPVADITARFTNGDVVAEIREVLGSLQRQDVTVTRADDGARYLMRIRPYRTRQNVIDGVVITFMDVTELKCAQEAVERLNEGLERKVAERTADLEAASRRKDDFLAMLSHELRNPLAAIASTIQLWRRRGVSDPLVVRSQELAQRQVAHMSHLLDDLLDTARIMRGTIELRRKGLDLRQVVRDVVDMERARAAQHRQEVAVALPPEPIPVEGDPDRLQQVVGNLLSNALRYTPAGGHIGLSAAGVGAEAVVRVRDDGIGLAPELLPHVFDVFVQGHRRPDRSQGGLGLGLTLARHLVELHGGSIEAYSAGPGLGSEFVVRLPLRSGLVETTAAPSGTEAGTTVPASSPKRILVVDDNADGAELLAAVLQTDGHDVVIAHNGSEALRLAAEHHPEVVLLDIGLPGMDGYEVAGRLRSNPELAGTRLVAITGYGQPEDRQRSREAGFDHHLVKPVDPGAIKRVL